MATNRIELNESGKENNNGPIKTTIGDLIEALTQVAIEAGNTEKEGYRLASLALTDLLKHRRANRSAGAKKLQIN
jgi:hypothetical protein